MDDVWERYGGLEQWDIQTRGQQAQRHHAFPGMHTPEPRRFLGPMDDAFLRVTGAAPNPTANGTRGAPIYLVDTPDEPPELGPDTYSIDVCYSKALDLFPKISRDYVGRLCKQYNGPARFQQNDLGYIDEVINDILNSPSYPKAKQERKRMWEEDEDDDEGDDEEEEEWPTHHGDNLYIESR